MKRAISDVEKHKRRETILMAALNAFFLRGYTATKMSDIAERAGISKGTLYLYFDSKEQMFLSVIQAVALPTANQISQVLNQASSVKDGLTTLFEQAPKMVNETALPKVIKVLISDAFSFPDIVKGYRQQVIDVMLSALSRLLARGNQTGEIKVTDPDLVAKLSIAPIIFSVIWTLVFEIGTDEKLDLALYFQQHKILLFKALGVNYALDN